MSDSFKASALYAALLLTFWGIARYGPDAPIPLLVSAALFCVLVVLAWYDFDHHRLPNWLTFPLILSGFVWTYIARPDALVLHALGALLGYGLIWGLNTYWRRKFGKEGIGMGDAKFLAAAGAWLGLMALPPLTLVASGSALALMVLPKLLGRKTDFERDAHIAFGPFIGLGFWTLWLFEHAY